MTDRPLFLHEYIDITGSAEAYMEHTLGQSGHEKVDFELLGTWRVTMSGRDPYVVNIWDIPGGWDGWRGKVDRLNLKRSSNAHLTAWWDEAFRNRSGGYDRLLAGHPGCPTLEQLVTSGLTASRFVHEMSTVVPGRTLEYLDLTRDLRAPALADAGHELVGLYEVLMHDDEVATLWAAPRSQLIDTSGIDDPRLDEWRARTAPLVRKRREELLVPHPGTRLYAAG